MSASKGANSGGIYLSGVVGAFFEKLKLKKL
jgi:hypothetical protein